MEGPSGDLIPKMKERFGIKSFDFVFLDHWKDRYVPDTKLLEVRSPKYTIVYVNPSRSYSNIWKTKHIYFITLQDCGLLRKGTVLLADNVICPGAPEYLKYVRNSPRYENRYYKSNLEYTKVEDGLEKSVFLG